MLPSEEPDSACHSIAAYAPASPTARVIDDFPLPWEGTNLAWVASVCAQNRVAILWTLRGTQRGEYLGAPASGNCVSTSGVDIYRIVGGKIAEIWTVGDTLGLLMQLGAVPAVGGESGATTSTERGWRA